MNIETGQIVTDAGVLANDPAWIGIPTHRIEDARSMNRSQRRNYARMVRKGTEPEVALEAVLATIELLA